MKRPSHGRRALGGALAVALAADLAAGQAKAKEICQACHGLDGNSATADYPKLAGQYPDYLAKALRDYKGRQAQEPDHGGHGRAADAQGHRQSGGVLRRAAGRVELKAASELARTGQVSATAHRCS
jgi:hypothetical protein